MKLSDKTIEILKNFVGINQSLLFKEGNVIRTMSLLKNMFSEATISEKFPRSFAIYDLGQFLNAIRLHKSPEIVFDNDSYLTLVSGDMQGKYYFSDESLIKTPPDTGIALPSEDVCFYLMQEQLEKLLKASSVYGVSDLTAVGDGKTVNLKVWDKENSTSNQFSVLVGKTDSTFSFNYRIENLKILDGNYEVVVSKHNYSRFTHSDIDLVYYIALEPDSTFE